MSEKWHAVTPRLRRPTQCRRNSATRPPSPRATISFSLALKNRRHFLHSARPNFPFFSPPAAEISRCALIYDGYSRDASRRLMRRGLCLSLSLSLSLSFSLSRAESRGFRAAQRRSELTRCRSEIIFRGGASRGSSRRS